jgi:hypothetical protein
MLSWAFFLSHNHPSIWEREPNQLLAKRPILRRVGLCFGAFSKGKREILYRSCCYFVFVPQFYGDKDQKTVKK